jgi:hypothetical protein
MFAISPSTHSITIAATFPDNAMLARNRSPDRRPHLGAAGQSNFTFDFYCARETDCTVSRDADIDEVTWLCVVEFDDKITPNFDRTFRFH